MTDTAISAEVLSLDADKIATFIQEHATARTLSDVVRRLNDELIAGDQTASEMAAQALQHLGFVETV
ncbi:hypothetical protein [Hasllibacter sp. MH4015]|uniref:hypothetical protein n=1 Tax=Hasllibacter sp. MH4015 TaxID=2854029 RepID=UPI001CD46FC9|nr:hypothetical protein [Hasllibacter sp. MH4015]